MKILCICQGGNVRSVACGYVLKYMYGVDAVAASWEKNSPETLDMLCRWADAIFVMQPEFVEKVYEPYRTKVHVIDVGPDVWFNSLHPELIDKVNGLLQRYPKAYRAEISQEQYDKLKDS